MMQMNGITNNALPAADTQLQASLKSAGRDEKNPAAARKVAQEFESMFVAMMLKSMRETVGKDTLTGGGRGEETFRSLLDQEYAAAATRGGGIGLAQSIERELNRSYAAPVPLKGVTHAD
jgi:flagellar protein FlgJ